MIMVSLYLPSTLSYLLFHFSYSFSLFLAISSFLPLCSKYGPFFCDCGERGCKSVVGADCGVKRMGRGKKKVKLLISTRGEGSSTPSTAPSFVFQHCKDLTKQQYAYALVSFFLFDFPSRGGSISQLGIYISHIRGSTSPRSEISGAGVC